MARKASASKGDRLGHAIAAIYAAGLDSTRWPGALDAIARAMNGHAATFENFDLRAGAHRQFHSFGVPPASEMAYLAHHIAGNPRWTDNPATRTNDIGWDYQFIDEKKMNRAPFYTELLAALNARYFISGVMHGTADDLVFVSVQFPATHGHVGQAEIRLMTALLPHLQGADDVSRRLAGARGAAESFERTLDWLDDGVAIVAATGAVTYANPALREIARRADVVRLRAGQLEFLAGAARASFDAALGAVRGLGLGRSGYEKPTDFAVARAAGLPRCLVSVRPLAGQGMDRAAAGEVLVFIRDPAARSRVAAALLRDTYRLTAAECGVALALQSHIPLSRYARTHGVTMNTVYTHLRRIREKTDRHNVAELTLLLEELRPPLKSGGG